jgi:hypothetical protein
MSVGKNLNILKQLEVFHPILQEEYTLFKDLDKYKEFSIHNMKQE